MVIKLFHTKLNLQLPFMDSHIVSENNNDEELPPLPEILVNVQIIESKINVDNAIVIHVLNETIIPLNE